MLGPRGLMPNPKTGTVTFDVAKAVKEVKAGKVEFRVDKTGIIHAPVGKIEFTRDQLSENAQTLIDSVIKARPAARQREVRQADHGRVDDESGHRSGSGGAGREVDARSGPAQERNHETQEARKKKNSTS